jgi:quercetin dioxygenase-like cupin family protein
VSTDLPQIINLLEAAQPQPDSIISRTVFQDDRLKAVLFGFGEGQELSEHTAQVPAIMHFLAGEADLTLGGVPSVAKAGTWVHMPAKLPHSVRAKTGVSMLLLLLKQPNM